MKRKKRPEHIMLFDGCHCTQFSVFPKNWDSAGADINQMWYIWYRFHDPRFKDDPKYKNGKLCQVKGDLSRYHTLAARRQLVKSMLETERDLLLRQHFNPITGLFMAPRDVPDTDYIIHPDTTLVKALKAAKERISGVKSTKTDLASVLNGIGKAAKRIRLDAMPIKDVRRRHVLMLLDQCSKDIARWSPSRYNKYRSYLLMLFKELVIVEAVEQNPVTDIPKEKVLQKMRLTLTDQERSKIDEHLRATNYRFWLYTQIFFHSGGRETELMALKIKDVDLQGQRYLATIKKGKHYRQEWRTIKDVAVMYWHQAVSGGNPDDYVFSKGLKPGPVPIDAVQISRRWRVHVKDKLGITADFYSLKHLNTDETASQMGIAVAAAHNAHRGTKITIDHYAVGHKERMHQVLKTVDNSFAPKANAPQD